MGVDGIRIRMSTERRNELFYVDGGSGRQRSYLQ